MRIGLIDIDGHNFPNLALMKLSAYYKAQGHNVELTTPDKANEYDKGFASKVFTYTAMPELPSHFEVGGSGADIKVKLPEATEHKCPDYNLYNLDYSLGFLTRGCIRSCEWCLVAGKEGGIKPHADITEFTRHRNTAAIR